MNSGTPSLRKAASFHIRPPRNAGIVLVASLLSSKQFTTLPSRQIHLQIHPCLDRAHLYSKRGALLGLCSSADRHRPARRLEEAVQKEMPLKQEARYDAPQPDQTGTTYDGDVSIDGFRPALCLKLVVRYSVQLETLLDFSDFCSPRQVSRQSLCLLPPGTDRLHLPCRWLMSHTEDSSRFSHH